MQRILLVVLLFPLIAHGQGWQWARGTTGASMDSWPVATDPSGNVFVAGVNFDALIGITQPSIFGTNTVPFSAASNIFQAILAKYDANGNFLWAIGTQDGDSRPINIATDLGGNSFLLGQISSPSVKIGSITLTNRIYPESQYFLAKFDPSGKVLWAINAGNVQDFGGSIGGSIYIAGTGGIATDAMNNIYVTANFHLPKITIGSYTLTNADASGNTDDILVVKYDSSGNVVWATRSGGSGNDDAYGLTVTPAGNIYIAGVFSSTSLVFGPSTITDASGGTGNAFIAEYNSSGTPIWAGSSGGAGGEFAVGIASDASNNVYLTGGVSDNSIAFSGTPIGNPYPGNYVLYLVKFNSSNNVSWFKTIGNPTGGDAWGYSIAMSPCGAIWVSGTYGNLQDSVGLAVGEVNIDGHILHSPAGSTDPIFIAGFNIAGTYAGSAALQSGADDQNGIACDALGNVYLCADYYYTCSPFIAGNDTLADISATSATEWQYIAKYTFVNVANPDTFYAHGDTAVCTFTNMELNAPQGYSSYLWENGSTGTTLPINTVGIYWVVGSGGCTIIDSITVTNSTLCGCEASLPTAFTPNNDGKNDDYHPLFSPGCSITNYSFTIYNRWGQHVFYSEDPTAKWNGTFQGAKADVGVYVYYLKYNSGLNNAVHTVKGDVTLIR